MRDERKPSNHITTNPAQFIARAAKRPSPLYKSQQRWGLLKKKKEKWSRFLRTEVQHATAWTQTPLAMRVSAEMQLHVSDFCGSHQRRCNCLRISHSIKPPCWKRIKAQVCRHDDAPWAAPTPPPPSLNNDRLYPLRTRLKGCSSKPPPPPNLMAFGHAGGADLELEWGDCRRWGPGTRQNKSLLTNPRPDSQGPPGSSESWREMRVIRSSGCWH